MIHTFSETFEVGTAMKSYYLSNRAYTDYDDLFEVYRNAWNKITPEQLCTVCHVEWILHEK